MKQTFEAVVVGLGPAGMAAAMVLAERGVRVAVIEDSLSPGGQIYRQLPGEFRHRGKRDPDARYRAEKRLIMGFQNLSHWMTVLYQTLLWGISDSQTLFYLHDGRIGRIEFEKLIICEGAFERAIPFPGWTLPGVMTAGGLQKLVSHQGLLPGKRFLLAGTGPLQISLAAKLLKAGAEIVALCEASNIKSAWRLFPELLLQKTLFRESVSSLLPVLLNRVPVLTNHTVVAALGLSRVEEVVIARVDQNWRPISGTEKRFHVDILGCGFGFQPATRLTRLCGCAHKYDFSRKAWIPETDKFMRSSMSNVYIAGDSAGIGGATMAEVEGRIAAFHIASELGRLSASEKDQRILPLFRDREKIQRYISILDRTFKPPFGIFDNIGEDTIVCRCEQVTVKEIVRAVGEGCRNLNEMKRRTRAAMGQCQGRTCESAVTGIMHQHGIALEEIGQLHIRPPIAPIPLSSFMADLSLP